MNSKLIKYIIGFKNIKVSIDARCSECCFGNKINHLLNENGISYSGNCADRLYRVQKTLNMKNVEKEDSCIDVLKGIIKTRNFLISRCCCIKNE